MFKKALLMLSIFFIVLKIESSYQQQELRFRGNSYSHDGGEFSEKSLKGDKDITVYNSFNGIVTINQTVISNQQKDESFNCSDYACSVGVCLVTYYFTGSGCLGVVTPLGIAVAANCICPQAME